MQEVILVTVGCGLLAAVLWAIYTAGVELGKMIARREMEEEEELPELWAEWDYMMEHEHGGESDEH